MGVRRATGGAWGAEEANSVGIGRERERDLGGRWSGRQSQLPHQGPKMRRRVGVGTQRRESLDFDWPCLCFSLCLFLCVCVLLLVRKVIIMSLSLSKQNKTIVIQSHEN